MEPGHPASTTRSRRTAAKRNGAGAVVLVSLLSPGCAGRFDRLMHSWDGRSLAELITTWGPPQQMFSDGDGGQVIVYAPSGGASGTEGPAAGIQTYGSTTTQPVYHASMASRWPVHRIFFVNASNRIVRWTWRGRWDVP